jgi:hypothetical protein
VAFLVLSSDGKTNFRFIISISYTINPYLKFAYDSGGFLFCLNLEDGSVTFVSMEDGLDYIKLADSFSAFINALSKEME